MPGLHRATKEIIMESKDKQSLKRNGMRTCMEPGCSRKIYYDVPLDGTTVAVPLYCEKHRSTVGRHSRTVFVSVTAAGDKQTVFNTASAMEGPGKRRRDYP